MNPKPNGEKTEKSVTVPVLTAKSYQMTWISFLIHCAVLAISRLDLNKSGL